MSNSIVLIGPDTISLISANTIELGDDHSDSWIDAAMPKLRVRYAGTLGATSALGDYIKAWMGTNSLTGNLDDLRTFMIAALDAIPVSHPARNAMALDDLRLLYWLNVTL